MTTPETRQCEQRVTDPGEVSERRCRRIATEQKRGRWLCAQHAHPKPLQPAPSPTGAADSETCQKCSYPMSEHEQYSTLTLCPRCVVCGRSVNLVWHKPGPLFNHKAVAAWESAPGAAAGAMTSELPCPHCGGWTQNDDGHRDGCPAKQKRPDDMDAGMLLVWEAWAKKEGNDGAAQLFRRCAARLRAAPVADSALRDDDDE